MSIEEPTMTTNDHEAGKVSDEVPAAALENRPIDEIDVSGWGVWKGHAIPPHVSRYIAGQINRYFDYRTRRAQSQTGAARDEGVIAKAYLRGIEWGRANGSTPQEAHKAAYDYADKTLSALEPTPIKKTAEPMHVAADMHSERANAEHVPTVSQLPGSVTMRMDGAVVRSINFMLESADEDDDTPSDAMLWIGDLTDDDGKPAYGLHLANAECPEEGGITLAELQRPAPPSASPAVPADAHVCKTCNGSGLWAQGVEDVNCHACNGTGEEPPAVPADVQWVTDEMVLRLKSWVCEDLFPAYELASEVGRNDPELLDGCRAALEAVFPLSDYQRLAAENERLRQERDVALENYTRAWNERDAQRRRAEAAKDKLAEAVKVLEPLVDQAEHVALGAETPADIRGAALALKPHLLTARTFLASLTTPPTEQGGM